MPRLINRYIFMEIAVPFVLSLSILTVTALLSKVIKLVELMASSGVGPSFLFLFIASAVPSFLIYTIPISFLIAVLVAFTRLSSDSEITAMKASGLSLFTMLRPALLLAVIAYFATLSFTLYLYPWGSETLKKLLFEAARNKLVTGLDEKTFYDKFKDTVVYVDRLSKETGEMEGLFISEGAGGESSVFFAKKGVFVIPQKETFSLYLKLTDGTIHRKSEREGDDHIAGFETYLLELDLSDSEPTKLVNKANRELYPSEIIGKIKEIRSTGQNPAPFLIDLHKRFALPASVFVFSLLGMPLGIQKVRTARFTGFSTALGVVLIYYVISTALEAMGKNGLVPPVVAAWGTDAVFGLIGLYVFYKASIDRAVGDAGSLGRLLARLTESVRGRKPH